MQAVSNSIRRSSADALPGALFWLLVAAAALPVRIDAAAGPFTTLSAIDAALLVCLAAIAVRSAGLAALELGPALVGGAVALPALVAVCSIAWARDAALAGAAAVKYLHGALLYFVALQVAAACTRAQIAAALCAMLLCWLATSAAMYLGVPGFGFFLARSLGWSEADAFALLTSVYTRLGHPFIGQSNDYGPVLALVGFLLLGYARLAGSRSLLLASGLGFAASLLTASRGLAAALLVGFCVYAVRTRLPLGRLALGALAAGGLLALAGIAAGGLAIPVQGDEITLMEIAASRLSEANVVARLSGYRETLALVAQHPWLGYGAGYYDRTYPDGLVAAHNAFLEQWKYFGVLLGSVTSACYLAIGAYFFGLRRQAGSAAPLSEAAACAWTCLVIAAVAQTFFEATTPRALIYLLLGLCVAMTREVQGRAGHR